MSDQTYLLIKLAAGVACLLLALIPAFIGKHKGYRFITYYTFGAASWLLALILALAVRPRKKRDPKWLEELKCPEGEKCKSKQAECGGYPPYKKEGADNKKEGGEAEKKG